jgi:hypothetical protein
MRSNASVMDEIDVFLDTWPDAAFGPAHIVLADSNLADGHILWCLGLCRAALSRDVCDLVDAEDKDFMDGLDWYASVDRDELRATAVFLERLLTIPESERDA